MANNEEIEKAEPQEEVSGELQKPYEVKDEVTEIKKANKMVGLPSINPDLALKYFERVNETPDERVKAVFDNASEKTLVALNKASDGTTNTFTYGGTIKSNFIPEPLVYGDTVLMARNRSIKKGAKGKSATKARVASKLGVSLPSIVYLYHSGFWIKLDRFGTADRIKLSTALTELAKDISRNTASHMYSLRGYSSYKIIVEAIKGKIASSSFKVPKGKDIFDFIYIEDINIIIAALFRQYYPKGFGLALNCKNALTDKDIAIKCDTVVEIDIDFYNTIVPFNDLIPLEARKILESEEAESLTESDLTEYRKLLKIKHECEIDLTDKVEGVESMKLVTSSTVVNDYIRKSQNTYLDISEAIVAQIAAADEMTEEEIIEANIQAELDKRRILSIGHYFKSLEVDDEVIEDPETIVEYLLDLEDPSEVDVENTIFGKIRKDHYKFMADNKVAIVGINDYQCPGCKETQAEDGTDLIEIDAFNVFYLAKSISH